MPSARNWRKQNASSLCRAFKKACGSTIFQFINRLRIEKACSLLKNTDLSITQIAYQVGFNSLAHFNNQFKKFARTLPGVYRKQ
ncbi:helix-turn-helix domain-containing protein [Bacteroides timonensis]|uniref:helix-turn-helix domain-containing protein n=1 Tax=Bacteroides timonensis TaxID=1470345 RepID=UPI0009427CED